MTTSYSVQQYNTHSNRQKGEINNKRTAIDTPIINSIPKSSSRLDSSFLLINIITRLGRG